MNQFMSNLMKAYLDGLRLSNIYNLIYLQAFQKALADKSKDVFREATTDTDTSSRGIPSPNMIESIYNRWLKNVDKELEKELRSDYFISLLSGYTQSLLELRSLFQKMAIL